MLRAKIGGTPGLKAEFKGVEITSGEHAEYKGPVEVTPEVNSEVILQTRDKIVRNDIRVLEIPIYEVSNESGKTLIIG